MGFFGLFSDEDNSSSSTTTTNTDNRRSTVNTDNSQMFGDNAVNGSSNSWVDSSNRSSSFSDSSNRSTNFSDSSDRSTTMTDLSDRSTNFSDLSDRSTKFSDYSNKSTNFSDSSNRSTNFSDSSNKNSNNVTTITNSDFGSIGAALSGYGRVTDSVVNASQGSIMGAIGLMKDLAAENSKAVSLAFGAAGKASQDAERTSAQILGFASQSVEKTKAAFESAAQPENKKLMYAAFAVVGIVAAIALARG